MQVVVRQTQVNGTDAEAVAHGIVEKLQAPDLRSYGEQSGMLLVNHTLTGLAIGAAQ